MIHNFAHGFLTLIDNSEVQYKCTGKWDKSAERTIRWMMKIFHSLPFINLKQNDLKISKKDKNGWHLSNIQFWWFQIMKVILTGSNGHQVEN